MMKIKVVLLQDNADSLDKLVKVFSEDKDFEVCGCSTDGIKGMEMVFTTGADLVVTDIILTGLDGFSFLERLSDMRLNIHKGVVSSFTGKEVMDLANKKGAEFYYTHPLDGIKLKEKLKELATGVMAVSLPPIKQKAIEEKVSNIFINVGIPPHIKGYNYLREGVIMAINNPKIINNITKKLYPSIGEKYSTTASKVERAIRHAIEVAWNRGRIETINTLFGVKAYVGAEKPTNGEFIALIADKMLLEMA